MAPATTSPATIAACRNSTSTMRRSVSTAYKGRALDSVTPDEVDDDLGQFGAAVLLEEVAAAGDGGVGLALGAGDLLLEDAVAAAGDGVAVGEGGEERAVERLQALPRLELVGAGRVVGLGRHEHRELPRPRLVAVVGERGVVGGDDLGRDIAAAPTLDDATHMEVGHGLRVVLPGKEGVAHRCVSRRQPGVGHDHAGELVGVLADEAQA